MFFQIKIDRSGDYKLLDISGIADEKNIDVWIYDDAGSLTLAYTEWSNDPLRATALVRQYGVLCKTGALEYRYLGSVRTSAAGETCDTLKKRFCVNYYNQLPLPFYVHDDTNSWTRTTAAVETWNNTDDNRIEFIMPVEQRMRATFVGSYTHANAGYAPGISIGLDAATSHAQSIACPIIHSAGRKISGIAIYDDFVAEGFHYLTMLQITTGSGTTNTFYGDDGVPTKCKSSITGVLMG